MADWWTNIQRWLGRDAQHDAHNIQVGMERSALATNAALSQAGAAWHRTPDNTLLVRHAQEPTQAWEARVASWQDDMRALQQRITKVLPAAAQPQDLRQTRLHEQAHAQGRHH